jgi:hypothetical protein
MDRNSSSRDQNHTTTQVDNIHTDLTDRCVLCLIDESKTHSSLSLSDCRVLFENHQICEQKDEKKYKVQEKGR